MAQDKGQPIPVIFKKTQKSSRDEIHHESSPSIGSTSVELNVHHKKIDRRVFTQEQIGIDKIVQDSDAGFYITGRTTKIPFLNFLQLIGKHDISQVEGKENEEVVVSADLIMRVATADVVDTDEEEMKYIDATAIGIFAGSFFLSGFALLSRTIEDIRTFSWILLLVSLLFLSHYTYRGMKNGDLQRYMRIAIKSLSKKQR